MNEPAPAPAPAPSPAPAPAPSSAPAPAAVADAPAAAERPAYIPEQFWDGDAKAVKADDFGKHYNDLTVAAAKLAERAASVPAKPEDYKIEVKLPEGVNLPEGVFNPETDPFRSTFLAAAHEGGWTNEDVNRATSLQAQWVLSRLTQQEADQKAYAAEETKKLGEKATERITAAKNWVSGLKDSGFTDDERAEINAIASSAAGVSALEKLIAKATGSIPGHVPSLDPKPAPRTHADRIWPQGFSANPQAAKAS